MARARAMADFHGHGKAKYSLDVSGRMLASYYLMFCRARQKCCFITPRWQMSPGKGPTSLFLLALDSCA